MLNCPTIYFLAKIQYLSLPERGAQHLGERKKLKKKVFKKKKDACPGMICSRKLERCDDYKHADPISQASKISMYLREGIPRRHVATKKLTCGPLVTWLSVWASFGVRSIMWRNQICDAGATLGNSGLPLSGHFSLFVVRALGT